MKTLRTDRMILLISCIFVWCLANGQPSSQNYVRQSLMLEPYTSSPYIDIETSRITIDYYDGLGRLIESVKQGAGGNFNDIYTLTEYNAEGAVSKTWLPIESPSFDGSYITPNEIRTTAQTFYDDSRPYSETLYEPTMEQLPFKQQNPGEEWAESDVNITTLRGLNIEGDTYYGCTRYDVSLTGELVKNGEYADGMLHYEEIQDEGNADVIKFSDRDKNIVLERKISFDGQTLDTYYVYNIYGKLSYVIPPKASTIFKTQSNGSCDNSTINKLCYYYGYDQYNRLVEKRLPGAEVVYYVYDALDNIFMSQDGNLRKENKWRVIKIDDKYRKAVEGISTIPNRTRASLQDEWDTKLAIETKQATSAYMDNMYYSNTCGLPNFEPLVSYFYDDYSHVSSITHTTLPTDAGYPSGMSNAMGLLTCKVVWEDWYQILTTYKYDDKNRVVLEHEYNLDGVYNIYTFKKYNFAGDLTGKKTVYNNSDLGYSYSSEYSYSYTNWGTLQLVRHRVNNESWTNLCSYGYDDVMRLTSKTIIPRKATSNTKRTSYDYNIRGWTTSLSSPLFQQNLYYNNTISGSVPQWNGSPSATTFTSINSNGGLENITLTYGYDNFDRLQTVSSNGVSATGNLFRESFSYDENGNPLTITRGSQLNSYIQYISLSYDGNQISSLNESKEAEGLYPDIPSIPKGDYESDWSYDANGNRTADPSRDITSITYNHLNQPLKISFGDGSYIEHKYRSDGSFYGRTERERIISTVNGGTSTTSRLRTLNMAQTGDFIFENTIPKRLYIEGGYIDLDFNNGTTYYYYYIHDNQGSVRAIVNEHGNLVQATDYSAYGVPSTRYQMNADNRFHLGLEWQPMKGLYGYYNNARFRDALLAGTFLQQDPLAEKYYPFSPYHYSAGNPLKFLDENGEEPTLTEALRMSSHVYGDQSDDILIGGWTLSQNKTSILNNQYGLKSAVYERTLEDGSIEYTYAFAGTQDITDILHDGLQLIGASGQYSQAIKNLQVLQADILTSELTLTGHSLGGGLAALGSMKTGLRALTFNAAGVSLPTKLFNGVNMSQSVESQIDAYILASDPISSIQNIPFNAFPDVNGNKHIIFPKNWNSIIGGHKIESLINSYK